MRYALCRIVVEDSVSLLFSESHFPTIDCADRTIRAALADIVAIRWAQLGGSEPSRTLR